MLGLHYDEHREGPADPGAAPQQRGHGGPLSQGAEAGIAVQPQGCRRQGGVVTVEPRCDGRCVTASDLGMGCEYGDMLVHEDPYCSLHGGPDVDVDIPLSPEEEEEVGIEWR